MSSFHVGVNRHLSTCRRWTLTRQHGPLHSHVSLCVLSDSGDWRSACHCCYTDFVVLAFARGPVEHAIGFHFTLRARGLGCDHISLWIIFLRFIMFMLIIMIVLVSLLCLVESDITTLGCRLSLVSLAVRLAFRFLLLLVSLIGSLRISGSFFRVGIGLLRSWFHTVRPRRLLSARAGTSLEIV